MFGCHFLILNLFSWLTFLSPQSEMDISTLPQTSFEVVITTGHDQSPAIVELGSYFNPILDSSQNSEIPTARISDTAQRIHSDVYEPKLLYFQIGNAIELELTSTSIIFPFHCFT